VHLSVRFARAREFVIEYAENLSQGGLFVKGAGSLGALEEVDVEIDLPGAGTYTVKAEVAHTIDAATATRLGRSAGAGLAITESPPGFTDALQAYLQRLGRRADVMVMVTDETFGLLLAAAGFQVATAPEPDQLAAAIAHSEVPVAGVVVSRGQAPDYQQATTAAGAGDVVVTMDSTEDFERVLEWLDNEL
jgi:hypothetical protein